MRTAIRIGFLVAALLAGCDDEGAGDGTKVDDSNLNLVVYESGSRSPASTRGQLAAPRAVPPEFTIGTTRQYIFDTLGDPDAIFLGETMYTPGIDYDADAYHVYEEVGLSFRIFGDTVREITLLSSHWIASNGLIVDMTQSQMTEILGDDCAIQHFEIKDIYVYPQYAISVEVYHADSLVGEINIQEGNRT